MENAYFVFADFSKAFDRVWHRGLLLKLKGLWDFRAIVGLIFKLFRKQRRKGGK